MTSQKIGRYEVRSELGRGGMATVFHAYDPNFERDVAIKVLPEVFLHDPQFRARFEREAKTIALLEHPAIVPVYDFGDSGNQPYIVMRYMSGGTLGDRLKQGALSLEETARLISRLAPALDAAHARGIIHRDIKPGNILFDQYGNAFLSDFGIAHLGVEGVTSLTGGSALGTPAYMSPEQIQGDAKVDGRSDIYALGVVVYQMLTGHMPYSADTPAKLMMMHVLQPVPQILLDRPDLPVGCEGIILRAMAKDPDDRFATAGEMSEVLDATARGFQGAGAIAFSYSHWRTTNCDRPTHLGGPVDGQSGDGIRGDDCLCWNGAGVSAREKRIIQECDPRDQPGGTAVHHWRGAVHFGKKWPGSAGKRRAVNANRFSDGDTIHSKPDASAYQRTLGSSQRTGFCHPDPDRGAK